MQALGIMVGYGSDAGKRAAAPVHASQHGAAAGLEQPERHRSAAASASPTLHACRPTLPTAEPRGTASAQIRTDLPVQSSLHRPTASAMGLATLVPPPKR